MAQQNIFRTAFIFVMWLALASGVGAQEQPPPLVEAKPPTPVAPVLLPYPPASNPPAVVADDVQIIPLPTPTPVYGRQGILVET
nr:hypothetical protein [Pyrinomonadaceae bacterium]